MSFVYFFWGVWKSKVNAILEGTRSTCHRNATELPFPLHIGFAKSGEELFPNVTFKTITLTCSAFYWGLYLYAACQTACLWRAWFPGCGWACHRNEPVLKLPAMSHRKVAPTGRKTHRRWKRWRLRTGKRWKSSMVMGCFCRNQLRSTIYIIYSMYPIPPIDAFF